MYVQRVSVDLCPEPVWHAARAQHNQTYMGLSQHRQDKQQQRPQPHDNRVSPAPYTVNRDGPALLQSVCVYRVNYTSNAFGE